jgi:hypothetical protein
MAPSYTPNDALSLCAGIIRQQAIAATSTTLMLDSVNKEMWNYEGMNWKWAMAALTAIPLVDATQDYTVANTDVLAFTNLRVTRTDVTPNVSEELDLTDWLAPDLVSRATAGGFKSIAWIPTSSKLRLAYCASIPTGTTMQIDGEYKKNSTKITASNLSTAFLFPDDYFIVFKEGLTYELMKFVNDARAGGVVVTKGGQRQFTGQYAVWQGKLQWMSETEDYGNAQAQRFPSEPMGVARGTGIGMFI